MTDNDSDDLLGPIDFLVVEFPGNRFNGELLPALTQLIAAGTVRILDLAFVTKDADGNTAFEEIENLSEDIGPLCELSAFLVELVGEEDLAAVAEDLAPNSSAALIVWENTWAAPFARAMMRSGGQVVASGRLATADVLAQLAEATAAN